MFACAAQVVVLRAPAPLCSLPSSPSSHHPPSLARAHNPHAPRPLPPTMTTTTHNNAQQHARGGHAADQGAVQGPAAPDRLGPARAARDGAGREAAGRVRRRAARGGRADGAGGQQAAARGREAVPVSGGGLSYAFVGGGGRGGAPGGGGPPHLPCCPACRCGLP